MMCAVHDVPAGPRGEGRHRRRGEPVCGPCKAEMARQRKDRRAAVRCEAHTPYDRCRRTTSSPTRICEVHRV